MAAKFPSSGVFMEKPAIFIETRPDGELRTNEEVTATLSQVTGPVCVVAIVGKYRTGKSYLMNRFFERGSGFALGSSTRAATKGVWLWLRPHPNDPSQSLVLLDTEGLHDTEKGDPTHDAKLFSLTLLICGTLLYNATGTLDDVIIRQLHLVTELTENIRVKQHGEEDGNLFNQYLPEFWLVLRDFFLELEIDGKPCTTDQYLEHALKLRSGPSKRSRDYNMPRECIRSFFPRRHCFALCKPVETDSSLARLDSLPDSQIKPAFLDGVQRLTSNILQTCKPLEVDGHTITGNRYIQLVHSYVDAINGGAVPCITSAVQLLKSHECTAAVEAAVAVFTATMSELLSRQLPVSTQCLTHAQTQAQQQALACYQQRAVFDGNQAYINQLTEKLASLFESHVKANNAASEEKCHALLQSLFSDVEGRLKRGEYTGSGGYGRYHQDKQAALDSYSAAQDLGPQKEYVLSRFLEVKRPQEEAVITADKALSDKDKQVVREREEKRLMEGRAQAAATQQNLLIQRMVSQQDMHHKLLLQLQDNFTASQAKLMQKHKQDILEKEAEYECMVKAGLSRQAEAYRQMIDEVKEDQRKQEREAMARSAEIEALRKSNQDILKTIREQGQMTAEQIGQLKNTLEDMQDQQESQGLAGGIFHTLGSMLGKFADSLFFK